MEFLTATEQHYEAIAHLVTSPEEMMLVCPACRYPWNAEKLRAIAQDRYSLTVALLEGNVVAFSNLYDIQPKQVAFIGNVIVSRAARGRGVGQAVIRHMMTLCRQHYQAHPHLSVVSTNTPALLMYTKLGFRPYEVERRISQAGEPFAMIHMRHGDRGN